MFQPDPQPSNSADPSSASVVDNDFLGATASFAEFIGVPDSQQAQEAAAGTQGDVIAPEIPPEMIRAALGPTFDVLFNSIAKVRGNAWRLDGMEKETLVGVWTPLVHQWLQIVGGGNAALVLAVTATGAVVGGKVLREKMEATKQASSKASIRTPESAVSSPSSASVDQASQHAPNDSLNGAYA